MRVPSSSHRPFPSYVTWPTREIKIPAPTRARNRGRRHRKLTRPSHEIRISFSRGGRTEKGRRRRRKWKEGDDPRVIFQASPSTTISRMMPYLSKDVSRLKTTNFFFAASNFCITSVIEMFMDVENVWVWILLDLQYCLLYTTDSIAVIWTLEL